MYIGSPVHELSLVVVCARVVHLLAPESDDFSFFGHTGFIAQTERMALGAFQEGILPAENVFHRLFGQFCQIGCSAGRQSHAFFLAAEGSAQGFLNDANLVERRADGICDVAAGEKWILCRGMYRHDVVGRMDVGNHCLRFDVGVFDELGAVLSLQHDIRLLHGFLHISFSDVVDRWSKDIARVLLMYLRCILFECIINGVYAWQLLIFCLDCFQRLIHQVLALCRYHGDRVARITDAACQVHISCPALGLSHFLKGDNRLYTGDRFCLGGVDAGNSRAAVWTAEYTGIQHPFHVNIRCIARFSGDLGHTVNPWLGLIERVKFLFSHQWHRSKPLFY